MAAKLICSPSLVVLVSFNFDVLRIRQISGSSRVDLFGTKGLQYRRFASAALPGHVTYQYAM